MSSSWFHIYKFKSFNFLCREKNRKHFFCIFHVVLVHSTYIASLHLLQVNEWMNEWIEKTEPKKKRISYSDTIFKTDYYLYSIDSFSAYPSVPSPPQSRMLDNVFSFSGVSLLIFHIRNTFRWKKSFFTRFHFYADLSFSFFLQSNSEQRCTHVSCGRRH